MQNGTSYPNQTNCVVSSQFCVFHGACLVLFLVGCIAMLSDAFGTRQQWVHQMIIDLMDPTNYNNAHYHERFLASMYRIVRNYLVHGRLVDLLYVYIARFTPRIMMTLCKRY